MNTNNKNVLGILLVAACVAAAGNVQASLIGQLDYSDSYTIGTGNRTGASGGGQSDVGAAWYLVENTHGNPATYWVGNGWAGYGNNSFQQGGVNTYDIDNNHVIYYGPAQNPSNSGAASGVTQGSSGTAWMVANARTNVVVQTDAVLSGAAGLTLGCFSTTTNNASNTAGSMTVFFDQRGGINLRGNNSEYESGLSSALLSDYTWHNYAVEFDKPGHSVSIYIDQSLLGTINLTTFQGGVFSAYNYDQNYVGFGNTGFGWTDNAQIGAMAVVPEPVTGMLLGLACLGLVARRRQRAG